MEGMPYPSYMMDYPKLPTLLFPTPPSGHNFPQITHNKYYKHSCLDMVEQCNPGRRHFPLNPLHYEIGVSLRLIYVKVTMKVSPKAVTCSVCLSHLPAGELVSW